MIAMGELDGKAAIVTGQVLPVSGGLVGGMFQ